MHALLRVLVIFCNDFCVYIFNDVANLAECDTLGVKISSISYTSIRHHPLKPFILKVQNVLDT